MVTVRCYIALNHTRRWLPAVETIYGPYEDLQPIVNRVVSQLNVDPSIYELSKMYSRLDELNWLYKLWENEVLLPIMVCFIN